MNKVQLDELLQSLLDEFLPELINLAKKGLAK